MILICVPFGSAGKIEGADSGVEKLKRYIQDKGYFNNIITIRRKDDEILPTLKKVEAITNKLREIVYQQYLIGNKVIILGGDHSISLGSISGAANGCKDKRFGVIYLDAHGDMNTMENSPTGNIHGMTLAASMGYGSSELTNIAEHKLNPDNLLLVGTRSLDKGELELIENKKIQYITSTEILESSIEQIYSKIDEYIISRDLESIHLSIDIDILDPVYAPGTGVPENNGISTEILLNIINHILTSNLINSIDIVEFNPKLDISNKTYNICTRLIDFIIKKFLIYERQSHQII